MLPNDIDHFRRFFAADRFAVKAGIVIDGLEEHSVHCSMEITPDHLNAGGVVQGGVIFTLADFVFGVHSNMAYVQGADVGVTLGQSCHISFLKASRGKRLFAKSYCLSKGRTMSVYRVSVEDDLGVLIAEFTGNAFTTVKKK